ncbi:phytoene/squalene synthase family protein [Candidatus Saccharibacteria bacterium]|nr:phytoene/squalene synthase family protein [Candidatus Saccharibacteria bacterium]NIW80229.1 squalene/phytoene synthase family protein [Calditrichia bacterium]
MKFWKNSQYKAAFEHARLLTAHYSKSFYISARLLPEERRWATFALYGFCRYADNLIDNPRNRSKAELLNEIDTIGSELQIAYRTGESEHPLILPYIVVAKKYGIPSQYPLELLNGVKMDIQNTGYRTFDDLYLFCYRVAGVVGIMMTYVLGYKDEAAFKYAESLGIAMQLTNILRDVQEDKEMGRIYLPEEELRRFGVGEQDIIQEKMSAKFHKLMKFQVERAHHYYEEANKGIPLLFRESQFAIYSASKIYRGILRNIEARNYNPFLGRVFVPQMKKIGILFQEVLRTRIFPFAYPQYEMVKK